MPGYILVVNAGEEDDFLEAGEGGCLRQLVDEALMEIRAVLDRQLAQARVG